MKKSVIALGCALLMASVPAFAAKKKTKRASRPSPQIVGEPDKYGMAGCGLGSMAIEENSKWNQVLASLLNGTGFQSVAITFGTSNCVEDGTVKSAQEATMFIEVNQMALATDIARGNGETLAHLSKVLGCQDSARVGVTLQKNYDAIFSDENMESSKVSDSIMNVMKNDASLSGNCTSLI